jgi:hypothetical protein
VVAPDLRGIALPEEWLGWVVVGGISAVAATIIGALFFWVWRNNPVRRWLRRRRDRKRAERDAWILLKEFQRRAARGHGYTVAINWAARHAGVENPGPAVELLTEWELVERADAATRPIYVRLTPKGLQADDTDG